jgi:hypothetical protein
MAGPEDVLPLSEHLYAVAPGWPAQIGHHPGFVQSTHAGRMLDSARRQASAMGCPPAVWPATPQPVGLLYREEGVRAILSWVTGLLERFGADAGTPEWLVQVERLHAIIDRAVETETPIVRLYEYAAEAPDAIVTIVSARKAFVFWDTEMVEDSSEVLPDMSALWTAGQAFESESGAPPPQGATAVTESAVAQLARSYERIVREQDARGECRRRQMERIDRLLTEETRLDPNPSAVDVIPSRAAILWRPRRLELIDVERLRRWLHLRAGNRVFRTALGGVLAFIDSASREHADLLLDAFCTDSPEAL